MDTKSTIKFATSPIGEALSKRQSQSTEQYSMSESTSSNGAEPSWSEPSGSPVRYTIPPSTRTTTGGLPSATLPEPPFKKPSKSPRRDRKAESEVPSYIHDGKVNWGHCSFKLVVTCALLPLLYLCWFISPFSGNWSTQAYHDRISIGHDIHADYFQHFEGHSECGFTSKNLYVPPTVDGDFESARHAYCPNRATLLEAMNGGGRHGFDAPFSPRGCHYRWYSTAEICMILERFDAVIFVGDNTLRDIYTGLNILLREDLALGGLKQWEMSSEDLNRCRCENQYLESDCSRFAITSSNEVVKNVGKDQNRGSPYSCRRTPHAFLQIPNSPGQASTLSTFTSLLTPSSPNSYKPIPIIHSLTSSTNGHLSLPLATKSLDEFLDLADASVETPTFRTTPFLVLNPPAAAGEEAWRFGTEMMRVASEKEVESLGLWNLTVQASEGKDGRYGERVGIVGAMMVVNWLARLESS